MRAKDVRLVVEDRVLLPGCSRGLNEKTAVITLRMSEQFKFSDAVNQRLVAEVGSLFPDNGLLRVTNADWPIAFVMKTSGSADSDSQLLGHWVVALTVAIQRMAGDPVLRGRLVHAEPELLELAIPWHRKEFFNEALDLSVRLLEGWLCPDDRRETSRLESHFGDRWTSIRQFGLPANSLRFFDAGVAQDMPFTTSHGCVQLGWGIEALRFDTAYTGRTSHLATVLVENTRTTKNLLSRQGIPVPRGGLVRHAEDVVKAADRDLGWPVVVKRVTHDPRGTTYPNIADAQTLRFVFDRAAQGDLSSVMIEGHVPGINYRLLVAGGKLVAAARLECGGVTGDGVRTVVELIEDCNADPRRKGGRFGLLTTLPLDEQAHECLKSVDMEPNSIPPLGQRVDLRRSASIKNGGTSTDVTNSVHEDNRALAERVARIVGLDIAGIDFITPDIGRSWWEVGGAVCGVDSQPPFRPFWIADPERDINGEVLRLVTAGGMTRIPTAAISGTNGKTTTSEMLYNIWTTAGKTTGVCTTQFVRIGRQIVSRDNLSGLPGAQMILNDPGVEAAVFEMPRLGLMTFGHACDRYDVSALLNIQDDHIGVDGVDTLEQMAELKAEVLERARNAIVVNADDRLCMAMRTRAGTDRHVLVTGDPTSDSVVEHRSAGGEAVFVDQHEGADWIVLASGDTQTPLMPVGEIPATMDGLLRFNVENAMFASAMAWVQGIDTGIIRQALSKFTNSIEQSPGRYNFIEGFPFRVLLDFAHNPDGVRELCRIVNELPCAGRKILCSRNLANRHAHHMSVVADVLAATFDHFVLGCSPRFVVECADYAGPDPVTTMLSMTSQDLVDNGVEEHSITAVRDPDELIRASLTLAAPGDLLVISAIPAVLPVIDEFRRSRFVDH